MDQPVDDLADRKTAIFDALSPPPLRECHFGCLLCGFSKRLHFDDDELLALDYDISQYTGPCPGCERMSLTAFLPPE